MEYKVISEREILDLNKIINSMIEDGWEVQGGVSIHIGKVHIRYSQAMIKN